MKYLTHCLIATAVALTPYQTLASEWQFGIGTGIGGLNISGDGGFNTSIAGPVAFDASLSPSEVSDYASSGLSLAFFAKKDNITINYSFGYLELEDRVNGAIGAGPTPVSVTVTQRSEVHDLNLEYRFGERAQNTWSGIIGFQNYLQEYKANAKSGGVSLFNGSVDDEWTDVYVGIKNAHGFNQKLLWTNALKVGGLDSDSYYGFNSTLTKVLNESWAASVVLDHVSYNYEQGSRGTDDWFLYDASETAVGLGVAYLF